MIGKSESFIWSGKSLFPAKIHSLKLKFLSNSHPSAVLGLYRVGVPDPGCKDNNLRSFLWFPLAPLQQLRVSAVLRSPELEPELQGGLGVGWVSEPPVLVADVPIHCRWLDCMTLKCRFNTDHSLIPLFYVSILFNAFNFLEPHLPH